MPQQQSEPTLSLPEKYIPYIISFLLGAGGAGGVGALTRPGDVSETIKQTVATANADDDVRIRMLEYKQEEMLQSLKRIEAKLDSKP